MRVRHQVVLPNAPVTVPVKCVGPILVVRHAAPVEGGASARQTARALVIARDTVTYSAAIAVVEASRPKRRVSRHVLEAKSLD